MSTIEYKADDITKAEFAVWMNSTITKYVIQEIRKQRDLIVEEILDGTYIDDHAKLTAKIGEAAGLSRLIDIEYGDIEDDTQNPRV